MKVVVALGAWVISAACRNVTNSWLAGFCQRSIDFEEPAGRLTICQAGTSGNEQCSGIVPQSPSLDIHQQSGLVLPESWFRQYPLRHRRETYDVQGQLGRFPSS